MQVVRLDAMRLDFDPIDHAYFLDGVRVPSVTQLIDPLYDFTGIPPETLRRKAAIGTAVHAASELIDADDLDDESVDPAIEGYLDGYRKFLDEVQPELLQSEQKIAHPVWRYAGTLDRLWRIEGCLAIGDLKTVAARDPSPLIGVQLAAYDLLRQYGDDAPEKALRFALQLKPDGTYKLHQYTEQDDYRMFMSLLTIHHWRAQHAA